MVQLFRRIEAEVVEGVFAGCGGGGHGALEEAQEESFHAGIQAEQAGADGASGLFALCGEGLVGVEDDSDGVVRGLAGVLACEVDDFVR